MLKHAICQGSIWLLSLLVPALLKMRRKGLGGAPAGSVELHLGRKRGRGEGPAEVAARAGSFGSALLRVFFASQVSLTPKLVGSGPGGPVEVLA